MGNCITVSTVDELVEMLNEGFHIDETYYDNKTAFIHHCENGNVDIVKYLVEHNCNIHLRDTSGITGFEYVCLYGHMDLFDYLVDLVDINAPSPTYWTPLSRACCNGQDAIVSKLLAAGANINFKNLSESTPLFHATTANIVHQLYIAGANINLQNGRGHTPLHYAANYNNYEVCVALHHLGADKNIIDNLGHTALDIARSLEHVEIINLLS